MKKLVYIFIFASIFFTSCGGFEEIDGGFPKELTFPKEGGEMNLTGELYIGVLHIWNGSGIENSSVVKEDNTLLVTNLWLTASAPSRGQEVHLKVEPNTTNEPRQQYIDIHDGPVYAQILIKQE